VYEAAVATIPALRSWVDPGGTEPITAVLPMAGLRNSVAGASPVDGLGRVGDAYSHTDASLAHGLTFAVQAVALAQALTDHSDHGNVAHAYAAATMPELRERYEWITRVDHQRVRRWQSEPVDPGRQDEAYALFCLVAGAAVAQVDADVIRAFDPRIGLLDCTGLLDDDIGRRRRIEQRFADLRDAPASPSGPAQDDLAATIAAAIA
jgi:hypothetical protein